MKKTAARISALLMAVCLTFTYAGPLQVNASGPGLVKDSTGAYLISSANDLNTFADWVNDGNDCDNDTIKLTADIIARDDFPMIGQYGFWSNDYFSGTFDGQGHAITVNINSDNNYVALFGCIKNASIKNLTLNGSVVGDNDTVYQDNATGGICAHVTGKSDTAGVPFENCVNNASVIGYGSVGGIVGFCGVEGDIDHPYSCVNCTNNGNITALDKSYCGGIIGEGSNCLNCVNTGSITADEECAGGIIGRGGSIKMKSCQNSGRVFSNYAAVGVVGYDNGKGSYIDCSNLGTIRCTGLYCGGIVGFEDYYIDFEAFTTMSFCYNLGDLGFVTSDNDTPTNSNGYGGLVGRVGFQRIIKIYNCYTTTGTSLNKSNLYNDLVGASASLSDSIRLYTCFTLSEHSDTDNITALSKKQFSSGEACYSLNYFISEAGIGARYTSYHQILNDTVASTGVKKNGCVPKSFCRKLYCVKECGWNILQRGFK